MLTLTRVPWFQGITTKVTTEQDSGATKMAGAWGIIVGRLHRTIAAGVATEIGAWSSSVKIAMHTSKYGLVTSCSAGPACLYFDGQTRLGCSRKRISNK